MQPLLAAIGADDVVKIVIILIVILSAVGGQLKTLFDKQAKPVDRPQRRPQPGPPQQPAEAVDQEIEAFLRDAARKPRSAPAAQPAAQPAAAEPWQLEEPYERPLTAEIVEQPAHPDRLGGGVSDHVEHAVDTSRFDQRSSQLGAEVGHADEKVEQRLHARFDHDLGSLTDTTQGVEDTPVAEGTDAAVWQDAADAEQPPTATARQIAAMFSNPRDVRQAVILSEILNRPEDRWQ